MLKKILFGMGLTYSLISCGASTTSIDSENIPIVEMPQPSQEISQEEKKKEADFHLDVEICSDIAYSNLSAKENEVTLGEYCPNVADRYMGLFDSCMDKAFNRIRNEDHVCWYEKRETEEEIKSYDDFTYLCVMGLAREGFEFAYIDFKCDRIN